MRLCGSALGGPLPLARTLHCGPSASITSGPTPSRPLRTRWGTSSETTCYHLARPAWRCLPSEGLLALQLADVLSHEILSLCPRAEPATKVSLSKSKIGSGFLVVGVPVEKID